jgi:ABC-type transporter Mla maintaining outer membrane lipid asymmetry ATPase subunit MlaF
VTFDFPPAPRSGEDVVNLRNVHKRYGSRVIYDGLDLLIRRQANAAASSASTAPASPRC